VVIDGLRYTEAFGDPQYQYIPKMGNLLKPQGTLFTNVMNLGTTITLPGHLSILTGDWQQESMYEGVKTRPIKPTIFEYFRRSKGVPQEKTWFVMGGKIDFLRYTDYSLHPLYGEPYKAYLTAPTTHHPRDEEVFSELQQIMDANHPSLVVTNFGNVDGDGHSGQWDRYTSAIQKVDSIIYDLWLKIQSDPFYKDKTTLLVTTDHGRHSGIFFEDHGGICEGDRHAFLLSIGPDFKKDTVIEERFELIDIAPTVGRLLGFDTHFARGHALTEGKNEINPKLSASSSGLHLVFEDDNNYMNRWQINYRRSLDGGKSWSNLIKISGKGIYAINPSITSNGDSVHIVWQEFRNGEWGIFYRKSSNGGMTWSTPIQISFAKVERPLVREIDSPWFPVIDSIDGENIYISRAGQYHYIRLISSLDGGVSWGDSRTVSENNFSITPDISIVGSELHVTWAKFTEFNWEIYYKKSLDDGKSWIDETNITTHPAYSYDPKITANNNGIHLIWTDYRDGHPEIYYTNKLHGNGFSEKIRLTNGIGSLHGDIISSQDIIYIVWEDYRDKSGEIFAKVSNDGGVSWSDDIRVSYSNKNISINPSLTIFNKLKYVGWQELTQDGWRIKVKEYAQ